MLITLPNVQMSFSKYILVFATCPRKCSTVKNDSEYITLVFEKTSLNKLRKDVRTSKKALICLLSAMKGKCSRALQGSLECFTTPRFIRLPNELSSA